MSRKPSGKIDRYFAEVDRHKLFDADDEVACAIALRLGDTGARSEFILANLRLVVKIAHEFHADFLPLEDRISEGNIGLVEAVDRFDPERGFRFSTYAAYWIKHRICLALCKTARSYRLPPTVYSKLTKYRKALEKFHTFSRVEPTDSDLAKLLGCETSQVGRYRTLDDATEVSLDNPAAVDSATDARISESLVDPNAADPRDSAMISNLFNELDSALLILSEEERRAVAMRYPLDGSRPHKIAEVAEFMSRSLETVRKLQKSGMAKIKAHLSARGIKLVGDILSSTT